MDYQFYVPVLIGIAGLGLMWYQAVLMRRQMNNQAPPTSASPRRGWYGRYWPLLAFIGISFIPWVPSLAGWNESPSINIPEFDAPDASINHGYGEAISPRSCYSTANGTALLSRQKSYKLAIACFVTDGSTDTLDTSHLQVSNLYDIHQGDITMRAIYKSDFDDYRKQMNSQLGIAVAMLNVPNGVEPSQFTTLRQARALGVKIISIGIAKSEFMLRPPLPGR